MNKHQLLFSASWIPLHYPLSLESTSIYSWYKPSEKLRFAAIFHYAETDQKGIPWQSWVLTRRYVRAILLQVHTCISCSLISVTAPSSSTRPQPGFWQYFLCQKNAAMRVREAALARNLFPGTWGRGRLKSLCAHLHSCYWRTWPYSKEQC